MISVVTKDAWRSSHVGAYSDWLLQLSGNLYRGRKLAMTCRVQAQQKCVPRSLSVVCNGWKGMLHVQWPSSSLAVYSTHRTAELKKGRGTLRRTSMTGLSQWKAGHRAQCRRSRRPGALNLGEGGRKERKGWEGCKLPQSSTTQAHIWFSMEQQFPLNLSPCSFPEHGRSRWRLI